MVQRSSLHSSVSGWTQPQSADGATAPAPASATARELLAARAAADGTTYENRASDPAYVEALLHALRDRAKDVARVRQRVVLLRAENARRAATLGVSIPADEDKKRPENSIVCGGKQGGDDTSPEFNAAAVQEM